MSVGIGSAARPARVAVLGVGILGACVGWNLSRRGAGVVFIDAGRPGEGVTDWSFSWVNASAKTARRSYFDLNVAGMAAHRELAGIIGPDSWWYPTGHLRWTEDPDAQAHLLETAGLLAGWGYRVEVYTGTQVRRLEPALALPDDAQVVFCPDEGWVHGRHLVARLLTQAAAAGAEHRFGTAVCDIGTGADGSVRTVALADGSRLDVDVVVNAAGPAAAHVAGLVARHLPMRREPGAVTRIDCPRVPVHRAMHAPHIEIRPDGHASVLLHSREVDALIDTGADPAGLARLLHASARQVVPDLGDARIARTRVVHRPIPADGYPSVGRWRRRRATTRPSPTAASPSHRSSAGCSPRRSSPGPPTIYSPTSDRSGSPAISHDSPGSTTCAATRRIHQCERASAGYRSAG
jgi:glycine/D-amino acid oxidase-like deaminating enzyme